MNTPRRNRLDQMVPVERALVLIQEEIEKLGSDERLTNAQIKINEAKDLISDFVDEQLKTN